jgi:hypothetical protein
MKRQILIWVIVLAAILLPGAAPQEVQLPDTDAGRIAGEYIRIVNSGDDQDMQKFIAANMSEASKKRRSEEERLQVFHELKGQTGWAHVHSILKSEPGLLSILLETERTGWVSFDFVFETDPPFKLDSIQIEQAEPPK